MRERHARAHGAVFDERRHLLPQGADPRMLVGARRRLRVDPLEDGHDERTAAVLVLADVDLFGSIGRQSQLDVGAPSPEDVDRLAAAVIRLFEAAEVTRGCFAADALFDLNVPAWRFQIQGVDDAAQFLSEFVPAEIGFSEVTPTNNGAAVEIDMTFTENGDEMYSRQMNLVETDGELITRVVVYCTGPWDRTTRERQASEAPMFRL